MIIRKRVAAAPLITCDPYFSVWSDADALNDKDTVHWTGRTQALRGTVRVDGKEYAFMGASALPKAGQRSVDITPTSTTYTFETDQTAFTVRFTTPLLLTDPELVSRPVTYVDFTAESLDGAEHRLEFTVSADENHCHTSDGPCEMTGGVYRRGRFQAAWMGKVAQSPLCHSADLITIDWGYMYIASPAAAGRVWRGTDGRCSVNAAVMLNTCATERAYILLAYDDVACVNYFGMTARAYWARNGKTILDLIADAVREHDSLLLRCDLLDETLTRRAVELAGDDYALLCALAYRQSIAAHKLIADENGDIIFLSKENNSNGCIGTVDVNYPASPLYLLFNTEYVKGMLRPIFKFAAMPVWKYDFAPHDVGRYPYATGQVYASRLNRAPDGGYGFREGGVLPPAYIMGAEDDIYDPGYQMPVEECGNMLILCAAVSKLDGNADFAAQYMDMLQTWACYLLRYGEDPENQLCTDDFAGHLAHNANLAAKAVMGIAAYAVILELLGRTAQAHMYAGRASRLARKWEARARAGGHTVLSFGDAESWSLKYNTVWDRFFHTALFSDSFYRNEIDWYLKASHPYGVPLDSRKAYTKSDWILWCAALAEDRASREALIAPVARYQYDSPDRVPFADWYDTETASYYIMRCRSVQGGVFMPMLIRGGL